MVGIELGVELMTEKTVNQPQRYAPPTLIACSGEVMSLIDFNRGEGLRLVLLICAMVDHSNSTVALQSSKVPVC